jgi:O-antigen/teichoic acid export membrane protein
VAPAAPPGASQASKTAIGRRLVGGTLNYGLGSMLPQLINFFLLLVLTRFLSPTDYGILELTATFGAIVVVIMRMGVPGAVTRFYFDHREGEPLRDYVSTINRFLLISSLVVGGLALGLVAFSNGKMLPGISFAYVGIVVFTSILSCNTDLQRRLLQAREQSRYAALLSLANALSNIGLAVVFVVFLHLGVKGMFLAQVLAGIAFFVQARLYLRPELHGTFRSEFIRPTIQYGSGVVLSHVLGSFAPFFVRSLLAARESLGDVGLFGIASRFTNPLMIVFTAFNTAFMPIYFAARNHESPESEASLIKAVRNTWTLSLFLFLATVLLGPSVIEIATPSRYHSAAPLVRILAVGLLGQATYLFLTPEIFYQKKTWMISLITFFGVLVNVTMSFLLVNRYGAYGVAWACAGGQIASGFLGGILSHSLERRISFEWRCIARTTLVASGVGSVLFFLPTANPYVEFVRGCGLLIAFLALAWMLGDPPVRQAWKIAMNLFARCFFSASQPRPTA